MSKTSTPLRGHLIPGMGAKHQHHLIRRRVNILTLSSHEGKNAKHQHHLIRYRMCFFFVSPAYNQIRAREKRGNTGNGFGPINELGLFKFLGCYNIIGVLINKNTY